VALCSLDASSQVGGNADSFGLYPMHTIVIRHGIYFCA
jgi:hypothetical protein